MKTFLELYDELKEKPKGLYNINKKRKEGRKMRKKGEKGAPKQVILRDCPDCKRTTQ